MQELSMFGFPIVFDPTDDRLTPAAADVSFEAYNRKYSKGMFGLLADPTYTDETEPYYDFYKAIGRDGERAAFKARALRYDSTVIMQGAAGGEFKKTAGHFHCEVPGKGMSYPEYYQVIKGTAVFVMQKVKDEHTEGRMLVEDCLIAEVKAGQAIVIPPNYGHCTVNVSDETMVFVNLVAESSQNDYAGVKRSVGMCCYILQAENGGYRIQKNPHYDFACEPKAVTPADSDALGIYQNKPVYSEYLRTPPKFDYLTSPENNMKDYFLVFRAK
ncbi:MAG TPA: glucose-6-phosphate isomerase family protein [Candidatus Limiplasma sp.]|nr:glucose-6-phosphate isomerase family protein [Candidatus Limiplasma sp.]HPS81972.1 glucose-6-phosphate isomerase family protein [Candidatus Limiplasma sp.]